MNKFSVGDIVRRVKFLTTMDWVDFKRTHKSDVFTVTYTEDGFISLEGVVIRGDKAPFDQGNFELVHAANIPTMSADPVNNPSHYASGAVECIDAIEASMTPEAFKGYLKGNVMKYMWRYEKKVSPVQDLEKAQWYQKKLIEVEKK